MWLKGTILAGPVNRSQSRVLGTQSPLSGVLSPCGHIGLFVNESTRVTSPIAPLHKSSQVSATPAPEAPRAPVQQQQSFDSNRASVRGTVPIRPAATRSHPSGKPVTCTISLGFYLSYFINTYIKTLKLLFIF